MASSPPDSEVYSIGTFRIYVILPARIALDMDANCFKSLQVCARSVMLIDDACLDTRGSSSVISMPMLYAMSITLAFDQPNVRGV